MSSHRPIVRLVLAAALIALALPTLAEAGCPIDLTPAPDHNYACYSAGTTHPLMHDGWNEFARWDFRYYNSSNLKRGIETFKFPGYPQENLKADWAKPVQVTPNLCVWEFTLPLDGIQCKAVAVRPYSIHFRGCNDGHIRDCYY